MKFERLQTPNGRLLYFESQGFAFNWNELSQKINEFVGRNPKLSYATEKIYLYFFDSPLKEEFKDCPTWVAREIVGQPQIHESMALKSYDLDHGDAYRFRLHGLSSFYPDGIKDFYLEAHQKLEETGLFPALTWRVELKEEIHEGKLRLSIFMDFFAANGE